MTILIPQLKPELFRQFESDFGTSIAETLWKRMIDHQNWLNKAVPVGIVLFFYGSQTYADSDPIDQPNVNWQFCDGSAVVNSNSPLFGQNVPDLRELFLKGSLSIGTLGGSDDVNLSHSHGGVTGATLDAEAVANTEGGADQGGPSLHTHSIPSALGITSKLPPYVELQPFMRII